MTGANLPAPLLRAFRAELATEAPGLERRRFLRRVVEGAVGPLPRLPHQQDQVGGGGTVASRTDVPTEQAVALAVAVVEQFDNRPQGAGTAAPPSVPPSVPDPGFTGRDAAQELLRRARRAGRRVREGMRR